MLRLCAEEQLKYIDREFKLGLFEGFSDISACIEACERRNLYAHTGGIVSKLYLEKCNNAKVHWNDSKQPKTGECLEVSQEYFTKTIGAFSVLAVRITQGILRRYIPEEKAPADKHLNAIGIIYLENEDYLVAEQIFDFALSIPEKHLSEDVARKRFIINKCIALYHLNRKDEMEKMLTAFDWSAMHPRFILAIYVLRDDWTNCTKLMPTADITAKEYRDWPLFRVFRKTNEFRAQYKKQFGIDFAYEPDLNKQNHEPQGESSEAKQ